MALGLMALSDIPACPASPKPRVGLFVSSADIEAAQGLTGKPGWAKKIKDDVLLKADPWLKREDAWIRDIMPAPGSRFAYGTAGCPKCGKAWKSFGKDVASLDRPRVLECPHCHMVFDLDHPKTPYVDSGSGVRIDGRTFWLQGVWNGFVTDSMWSAFTPGGCAVTNLGDAYALTGDERYAHKAAVIMDALATLAPKTNGPRDFNEEIDKDMGRLQHLTSIVFRAGVHFARALDVLGNSPAFTEPSPTYPGRTIWENIRQGIFEDYLFVPYDTRNGSLRTLHNHEADSVRGLLLTGLLFGYPDYVRWGAEEVLAFMDNTIDRDGLYYETSLSYTDFTRSVFVEMAELLARYDPSHYPTALKMPRREELPLEGNYFNHPRLARLTLDLPDRVSVLGRKPTFGNNHLDTTVWKKDGKPFSGPEYEQILRFVLYATEPGIKSRARSLAASLVTERPESAISTWGLYHNIDIESGNKAGMRDASDFTGQTALVMLRSGKEERSRAAVIRSGANMPHAHNDQGALLLYANGRSLSGDIGYGIFGNHVHLGWATQAIAHNTVVVNKDASALKTLFRVNAGGTVESFHAGEGVQWSRISLAEILKPEDKVGRFARTVFQVDLGPDDCYWVDIFDVSGGKTHDYSFHANPVGKGSFQVEGIQPEVVSGVWTLAGFEPEYRDAVFDAPGRSWGERLTPNGLIRKIPGVTDEVPEAQWWYATPGNGNGFLYDVRNAEADRPWSAVWRWKDGAEEYGLRYTMVPDGTQKVITALGPTLTGADTMNWFIARREAKDSLTSRFAGVIEPFDKTPNVTRVDAVPGGIRVATKDTEDIISSPAGQGKGIQVIRRKNGEVRGLFLSGAKVVEADGFRLRFPRAAATSTVTEVDDTRGVFRVSPSPSVCSVGSTVRILGDSYKDSTYRIGSIDAEGWMKPLDSDITLARGREGKGTAEGFESMTPLPFANVQEQDTRFFDGKRIVCAGKTGVVRTVKGLKSVVTNGIQAQAGEQFAIYDIKPGDTCAMDFDSSLIRGEDGTWTLRSNGPVSVSFPWPVERMVDGVWKPAGREMTLADDALVGEVRFRKG